MTDENKKTINENLTQKDIVQMLLHNAQHMVTREELKSDIKELKDDIKQDISKIEKQIDSKISKVESQISKVESQISKVDAKFDKILWLIVATTITILLKDSILSLF